MLAGHCHCQVWIRHHGHMNRLTIVKEREAMYWPQNMNFYFPGPVCLLLPLNVQTVSNMDEHWGPPIELFLKETDLNVPSILEEPVVHPHRAKYLLLQVWVLLSCSQIHSQHHFLGFMGCLIHRHEIPLNVISDHRIHFIGKMWEWVQNSMSCLNGVVRK